jgi:hypothetical protein
VADEELRQLEALDVAAPRAEAKRAFDLRPALFAVRHGAFRGHIQPRLERRTYLKAVPE